MAKNKNLKSLWKVPLKTPETQFKIGAINGPKTKPLRENPLLIYPKKRGISQNKPKKPKGPGFWGQNFWNPPFLTTK